MSLDIKEIRKDFEVLKKNKVIYFDNAATSLKPNQVIENINKYYKECPANIHRGIHNLSMKASIEYEDCYQKLIKFVNCKYGEAIFCQNSTDAINQVMYMIYNSDYINKSHKILTTVMEHHSNLVPFQFLSKKTGAKLDFIEITKDFDLDYKDLGKKLTKNTKLLTITHISNTIATKINLKKVIDLAHKNKTLVLVDASQSAPHQKIDFKRLGADFLVFTAHKMLGPTGVGVLVSKKELLEKFSPVRFGGDMISNVSLEKSSWSNLPNKFQAGTPNIAGIFGFNKAMDYINDIGYKNIKKKDEELLKYALEKLTKINNLTIYNPKKVSKQAPILLFELKSISAQDLTAILDDYKKIATRAGMHCAQPIVSRFNKFGLTRASFYFYNTFKEIDVLYDSLKVIDSKINRK